jgi:hypothetical protein
VKNIDVNDKMNDSSPMMANARVGCRQFTHDGGCSRRLPSVHPFAYASLKLTATMANKILQKSAIDQEPSQKSTTISEFFPRVGNDETHTLVFNGKICLINIRISKRVVEQAVVFVFRLFSSVAVVVVVVVLLRSLTRTVT